jgi:hypothetical protein
MHLFFHSSIIVNHIYMQIFCVYPSAPTIGYDR